MTNEERLLARVMFVNRVLKANGTDFQRLFWSVMSATHGDEFVGVRPQGRIGDGGNDGYLPATGHYVQVYGALDPAQKVSDAEATLKADFDKVLKSWGPTTPVKKYSFVFNDKYEGTFTTLAQALGLLEKQHGVQCRPFTAANLEDAFMYLPPDQIRGVLGPDPIRWTV